MKIEQQRTYPHSPDAVWKALTDKDAIRRWWLDTDFAPEPGRAFFMQDTPQGSWDGKVTGKVLEVDAPHRIVFSWNGGGVESTVTYELTATGGGTHLRLVHDGFRGVSGFFLSVMLRFGWIKLTKNLLSRMAGHYDAAPQTPLPMPTKQRQAA